VARMAENQNSLRGLRGNPEGNTSLVVPKCRSKKFKRGSKETGWDHCTLLGYYALSPEDGPICFSKHRYEIAATRCVIVHKSAVLVFFFSSAEA
jgi:hypothetical protein